MTERVAMQVGASVLLVAVVLYFMWRMPRRGDALAGWAPPLAFMSAWSGLLAVVFSALLWVLPYPDLWVVALFLVLDPLACAAGVLVLWIHRGATASEPVDMQRLQARVGVALGAVAVAIGYVYVMTHKTIGTAPGAAG